MSASSLLFPPQYEEGILDPKTPPHFEEGLGVEALLLTLKNHDRLSVGQLERTILLFHDLESG